MRERKAIDSGQAVVNDDVQFRDFRRGDIETCARISADAWPETANVTGSGDTVRTMKLYVEFYYYSATWLDVACVDGQVVGLLFGRIDRESGISGRIRSRLGHVRVYLKLLTGRYWKGADRFKLVRSAMSDDRSIVENSPDADGEVMLFVVDGRFQGKGIGKALMDRFLQQARKADSKRITVSTNDIGCNWGFYDKYGFKLQGSFRDSFTSIVRKQEIKNLIFSIDL
jgi:ribosomal protein S18 acetylase RimI-like enzyme